MMGSWTAGVPLQVSVVLARDLPEAWWRCIREVLRQGREYTIDSGSYAGQKRKELDFVVVEIEKPWMAPMIPDVPEGFPPPTSMDYITRDYLRYLATSVKMPNEQYTYGEDLESQVIKGIEMYKKSGHNTNQVCFSVGNRDSIGLEHSQCLRVVDTRIMDGALHFIAYFRSWDLYAGFPTNLAGLELVKQMMADDIGVKNGAMVAMSKGLHLYDHHFDLGKVVTNAY